MTKPGTIAFALAFAAGLSSAQVAPTPPPTNPAKDGIVALSPFMVEAASEKSYGALNSNSITSFNAALERLPISADVLTSTFMEDTNSTTLENMLRTYSAGSGTGSAQGDVAGIPVNQPLDRGGGDSVSAGVQLRGLGAAVVKQDSFMLPSPAGTGLNSNFGAERVEVINGPQALLYGNGGGGGVVNVISRQARFGRPAGGALKFQIDSYGHPLAQLDYSASRGRMAYTFSALNQQLGDNRDFIGGPLHGVYTQVAWQLPLRTTLRLTGKLTRFDRLVQQGATLNAGSVAADGRHNQNLRYLLATNQLERSATGASGAGVIAGGHLDWNNVDSFAGNLREELTTARLGSAVVETAWRPWLTTQLSLGYQNKDSRVGFGSGISFFAPAAAANPLPGQWSVGAGGTSGSAWSNQPSRSRSFRFSALLTHAPFRGRAQSQTIVGADHTRGHYANENFAYYEADASFKALTNAAGVRTRLLIPNPYFAIADGPVKYPFYAVGTPTITYLGKNYVGQVMNLTDPRLVSPSNPQGVTATDLFIHSRAVSGGVFAVNYTQWDDGRLATLAGMRYVSAQNRQFPSSATPAIEAKGNNLSFSLGANYRLASWLRPFVTVSDTYNLPAILLTVPADPLGNAAPIAHSIGEEAGVKLGRDDARVSGSISVYALQSSREPYAIPTQLRDSINPAGLNGRYLGATGSVVAVERRSHGAQVALTTAPTPAWRMRLSAAFVQGTIGNNQTYAALYNDQFHANAAGQVTYANGTPVFVRPAFLATPGTAADAGYIPLTIDALSTPGHAYYANPDPVTGLLQTSNGRTILNYVHPANGAIRTGAAGQPIARYQLRGVTPIPEIVVARRGDRTTGYPGLSLNYTALHTFAQGALKGVRLGGTANLAWKRADYYYYPAGYGPTAARTLFYRPTSALLDAIAGYQRRFGRIEWSTQLNVTNVLNHYSVLIRPNNITGYSGINNALFTNQPREWAWSNTFRF